MCVWLAEEYHVHTHTHTHTHMALTCEIYKLSDAWDEGTREKKWMSLPERERERDSVVNIYPNNFYKLGNHDKQRLRNWTTLIYK